ncbi:MAG: IS5/IS1182 family transposase, partial [Thermomicrobiales bacterium]
LEVVRERFPGEEDVTIHLDAGYDSAVTRALLDDLGYAGVITPKGQRIAVQATSRWVIDRTNAWQTRGFRKLAMCTERRIPVIAAFIALANVIIIIRRLRAEAWTRYRWESRPTLHP